MDVSLNRFFSLVKLTSGRRLSAYNAIRAEAQTRGLASLVTHIERAIAHERLCRELEAQWAAQSSRGSYTDEVHRLDSLVDQTLTSIRDVALAQATGLDVGHPIAKAAATLTDTLFPTGVRAITSLPVIDQAAAVEDVARKLQDELRVEVAVLGLERRTARLGDLSIAYRAAVDAYPEPIDFALVRQARERGRTLLLQLIARILGACFDSENPSHVEMRVALLGPILAQQAAMRARRRARRRASRSDDTGNTGDTPAGDTPGGDAPAGDVPAGDTGEVDSARFRDEPTLELVLDEPATSADTTRDVA